MGAAQTQQLWCTAEDDCCEAKKLRLYAFSHTQPEPTQADAQEERQTERLMERLFDLYDEDGRGIEQELLRGVVERIGAVSRGSTASSAPEKDEEPKRCEDPNWCMPDLLELAGLAAHAMRGTFDPSAGVSGAAPGGAADAGTRLVEREEFRQLVTGALRTSPERPARAVLQQVVTECFEKTLDSLISKLFAMQDLNDDGFLEESELVQLNKKVAMLHYGKDVDKEEISAKFRSLFRSKLDADGSPVSVNRFREHILAELHRLDGQDGAAQCAIVEQWIAEALAARQMFRVPSMQSINDLPFLLASALELSVSEEAFDGKLSKVVAPRAPVPSVTSDSTAASLFSSERSEGTIYP